MNKKGAELALGTIIVIIILIALLLSLLSFYTGASRSLFGSIGSIGGSAAGQTDDLIEGDDDTAGLGDIEGWASGKSDEE